MCSVAKKVFCCTPRRLFPGNQLPTSVNFLQCRDLRFLARAGALKDCACLNKDEIL